MTTATLPSRTTYHVIDKQTGAHMGTYATRVAARRRADKLDLAYGAIRYLVRLVS